MSKIVVNGVGFKNADSPFTELFSLFQQEMIFEGGNKNSANEIINQHIDNATELLLQGLQSLGQLIGRLQANEQIPADLMTIGFFISLVCNLVETLNLMRLNAANTDI